MSIIRLNPECITCLLNKYLSKIPDGIDTELKLTYMQKVLKLISDADWQKSAPEITSEISEIQYKLLGIKDDFTEVKKYFNSLMLSLEAEIENTIKTNKNPLNSAISYAMLGNYIDFGAMQNVDEEKLKKMLSDVHNISLDETESKNLKTDLKNAKKLIYITDNCGEIVLDKLLIKEILKEYPHISAEVLVRGANVLNDATVEDAKQVGLDTILPVYHNGNNIAGTCLSKIPQHISEKLENADVIIAKGQANFETLRYCGKNIYYIFMCKCELFANRFGVPKYSGMLLNDLRMK